jgi:hypothetical protein
MTRTVLTRHLSRASALLVGAFVGALAIACGSPPVIHSQGRQLTAGSSAVTLVNLHATNKTLDAVNRQGTELIPVCSNVQIVGLNAKRLVFTVEGVRERYSYTFHKAAGERFVQHLARYFGSRCPEDQIARMNALDQAGVKDGKPYLGMTKSAMTIAMGYPPRHKTPSLQANTWRYWLGRRSASITFDRDGLMTSAKGFPAGSYDPPSGLGGYASSSPGRTSRASGRQSLPSAGNRQHTYTPPPPQTSTRRSPPRQQQSAPLDGALYSKRVAVVVGINEYEHWPSLTGASNDGRRMAEFLRNDGWDEVIEIYDGEATRRRMLRVLGTELPRIADEDTLAMIYFAGHGQTETLPGGGKRGYLIPVDSDTDDVFSTAISMDTVRDLSKRTPAKHVYYAIDACYSGLALTRGLTRTGSGPPSVYLRKITSVPAVQIITAGADGEQAIEVGGQGLFTSYLLRALQGEADYNHDGAVTASEIGAYVKPQVTNASRNQQTPQFGTMEGSGEVVFMPRR